MTLLRRLLLAAAAACTSLALTAAPSLAIVGGHDAAPGAYPSIAEITFGSSFLCTGTLIAPDYVLTAGHCGSITGAAIGTPAGWPAPLIDVRIGANQSGQGEKVPVSQRHCRARLPGHPGPRHHAAAAREQLDQGADQGRGRDRGQPVGGGHDGDDRRLGHDSEGGDTPDTLQEAQVPITSDATCAAAYSDFDPATMVCAGYPAGRHGHLPGRLGRPALRPYAGGRPEVVGATSFGEGCARAGKPGVYARVADTPLREWIRAQAPAGVD